jgi:hypothetical protein
LVWALGKGNIGWQYPNQTTLDLVYERLMHEFNQLEDSGHHSINGMIEKCATLAWKFYGKMDAEDKIDDNNMEEDSDDSSVVTQDEAPEAPDAVIEAPGDQGGIVEVKRRR